MQRVPRAPVLLAILPATASPAIAALTSIPDRTFVSDGHIHAVARSEDTIYIYIGGQFTQVGPRSGPGVGIDAGGSLDTGLPKVAGGGGSVNAVVADGAGGWYIGRDFTHVGGVARSNIAHIRPDKSVDVGFDPDLDDAVYALALSGSLLFVGGSFKSIGGQPRSLIAALDAADGTATGFDPDGEGFPVAPNPSRGRVRIEFALPREAPVRATRRNACMTET